MGNHPAETYVHHLLKSIQIKQNIGKYLLHLEIKSGQILHLFLLIITKCTNEHKSQLSTPSPASQGWCERASCESGRSRGHKSRWREPSSCSEAPQPPSSPPAPPPLPWSPPPHSS